MKALNRIKLSLSIVIVSVLFIAPLSAQEQKSKAELRREKREQQDAEREIEVKKLISGKEFTFVAESMSATLPTGRRTLSGGYSVIIEDGKLDCLLPYVGRNELPDLSNPNPFDFSSVDYSVEVEGEGDSTIFNIDAKAEENSSRYEMVLEVFTNGNAALTITYSRGSTLFYNGYITKNEQNK